MQRRNAGFEGSNIKLLTDDTRRGNQHVFGHAADRRSNDAGSLAGVFEPNRPSCSVGDARVDYHSASKAVTDSVKVFARNGYRSRAEHVLGKHSSSRAQFVRLDQCHVKAVGVIAKTGMDATGAKALGGRDATVFDGNQVRFSHIFHS